METTRISESQTRTDVVKTSANLDAIRPDHYGGDSNPFEPIKIINHYQLGFCIGNVLKYILRAGRKDPSKHIEDLKKARQYLDFEIAEQERRNPPIV